MEDSLFPSGSHWGLTQLQHLRFPSQPETKPLEDLQWKQPLNQDGLKILEEMEQSFALDESEWKDRPVRGPYEDFYGHLSDMLPRLQEKHLTPKNAALRSNTHLPSSSTRQSSSPWSVGSTTTTRPLSAQKTPSKSFPSTEAPTRNIDTPQIDHQSESDEEVVPTPLAKRQREDSDSPTFPPKPFKMSSGTSIAPLSDADFRSSQTDSTFHSSEHPPSDPDDVSDGDRAESGVTFLMQSMLNRICKAHNGSNGYTFSVGHNVETLTIPICGSFPTTKPDLLVTMHRGRRTYSIVDFEAKRLKMQMTKEEKFGQEVAHLLGRANLMKCTKTVDEYKVFLISAHNTNISISTSSIQNRYLHRLQTKIPGPTSFRHVVKQYGPFDLVDTNQRVVAASMIYRLMLDRAAIIQQPESS